MRRRYLRNRARGNIIYPGLIAAWSAKGKSNDDEDRATLRDLTGNGHDITLNGFAFSEMSGYGGYTQNYNILSSTGVLEKSNNRIILQRTSNSGGWIGKVSKSKYNNVSYKINIVGLNGKKIYLACDGDLIYQQELFEGENLINSISEEIFNATAGVNGIFFNCNDIPIGQQIIIEQIPEYPDALVFDGVDDYGIANIVNNFDNGFTVIAKRKYLNGIDYYKGQTLSTFSDNNSIPFLTSETTTGGLYGWLVNYCSTNNFIKDKIIKGDITYINSNTYNGIYNLFKGNSKPNESKNLRIGRLTANERYTKLAFYSYYLFDRSLDEQEIKSFIRKYIDAEYLLPSEIPTPDCYYDFSQGSNDDETRDTIKDLSGNGNDAVAHNFAWSGMSGYGGYGTQDVDTWHKYSNATYNRINATKIEITAPSQYFTQIKLNGDKCILKFDKQNVVKAIQGCSFTTEDGYIYKITKDTVTVYRIDINSEYYNIPIIVESLPLYEGALVFDGVDDYVSLDAFDSGFKTVFMVCKPFKANTVLYDQRTPGKQDQFGVYNTDNDIAYNNRQSVINYINGKVNTKIICKELLNKKHVFTLGADTLNQHRPIIGATTDTDNYRANMAVYKFLGFKEELTEDQIQYVIKKYNLLDGVDEIEVS